MKDCYTLDEMGLPRAAGPHRYAEIEPLPEPELTEEERRQKRWEDKQKWLRSVHNRADIAKRDIALGKPNFINEPGKPPARLSARTAALESEGTDPGSEQIQETDLHQILSPESLHHHAGRLLATAGRTGAGKLRDKLKQWHEDYGPAGAAAMAGAYLGVYAAAAVLGPKVFMAFPAPSLQIAAMAKLIRKLLKRKNRTLPNESEARQ